MKFLVVLCALLIGCASTPKTPQDLNISRASIVAGNSETKVAIDGWSDKASGAIVGGAKGAGIGAGSVAVLCLAAGPMYAICVIGAIPLGALGATVGTLAGAVTTESATGVETKRTMLTEGLNSHEANKYLATLVYKKSLESLALQLPQADKTSTATEPEWSLRIGLDEFATVGSGPDTPYSLRLTARVEVMHMGNMEPAFSKGYLAKSPLQMTTAEWRINNDEPIWSALDGMLATLASDISNDWMPIQLSLDKTLEDYKRAGQPITAEKKSDPVPSLNNETDSKNVPEEITGPREFPQFIPGDKVSILFKNGDIQKITITYTNERFVVGYRTYYLGKTTGVSYDRRDIKSIEYVK